jgi:hypothetical protein
MQSEEDRLRALRGPGDRLALPTFESPRHQAQSLIPAPPLREFVFSVGTLEVPLRVLTGFLLAEVASAAALIAVKDILLPRIKIYTGSVEVFSLPWLSYVIAGMVVLAGYWLLTYGTLQAGGRGRLLFVGTVYAFFLVSSVLIVPPDRKETMAMIGATTIAIGYWVLCGTGLRLYQTHYGARGSRNALTWIIVLAATVPGFYLLFAQRFTFTASVFMLFLPLLYIFLLAGTDWAEIVDAVFLYVLNFTVGKLRRGWLALFGVAVCGFVAFAMNLYSGGAARDYLFTTFSMTMFGYLVVLVARIDDTWPTHFSWGGLAIVTVVFFLCVSVMHALEELKKPIPSFWPLGFSLIAAVLLMLYRRRPKFVAFCPVLLFAVILGLFETILKLPGEPDYQWLPIDGAMYGIAVCSIFGIFYLLFVGTVKRKDARLPILCTILLNIGCFALYILAFGVYEDMRHAGARKTLIEAAVVFGAILWDILVSGRSLTNVEGKMFPRRSRVFLFFGYVLMATATAVFWSSIKTGQNEYQAYVNAASDPEYIVELGVILLGPSILLTLYLIRLGKWVRTLDL